jgi:hypothetical protein
VILDTTESYALAFYIIGFIMVASAIFTFFVRPPQDKSRSRVT